MQVVPVPGMAWLSRYIQTAQRITGAIVGAWVSAGLVPGAGELISTGGTGPGCFDRSVIHADISDEQAGVGP